ncbi:MAG: hypothetical protein AABW79_03795 [Nanoarchaeota archaeon]
MSQDGQVRMPGVFGGLMRYDSEFDSALSFSPVAVVAFVVLILVFVFALKIFVPVIG